MSWGEGAEVFMGSEGEREIGVKSSHSLGEKAVEQSDRASFDTPVPSTWWQELEEVVGGMGGSFTMLEALLDHHVRKMSRVEGRGAPMIFAAVFTIVVGSCGQQHCSSHTRQWCRWSAHSQWCPCRKWWGWVEGDLPFSAGGESGGAVVPSCWVTWRWWSRWDPL